MSYLNELENEAAQLQAKLQAIEAEKQAAKERERAEQLDLIRQYEEKAEALRNQAAKAVDSDKPLLYQYADDAEEAALQIRKELGILPENVQTVADRERAERSQTARRVNSLLLKSLFALVAFLMADFTAGQIEMGFTSFALKYGAQILFNLAALFGGVWVAYMVLSTLTLGYSFVRLKQDFRDVSPAVRLAIWAALFAVVIHLLTAVIPHAN